jgi:ATP-dependent helicase/nuclease subunit B
MAERSPPRVFNIPSGAPFLDTLADALLAGRLVSFDRSDPLALAGVTILLPTRRAARALRDVLVRRLPADAAILPAINTIGDVDEEAHLLAPSDEPAWQRLALPAAVGDLERRLTLTRLVMAWGRAVRGDALKLKPDEPVLVPASAADAARLAGDLARLLDDMEIAGIPWDALHQLAPAEHAGYFQITLDFLKIVAEQWPKILKGQGLVDPAVRRDALIRAAAKRVAGPIVAAGSTGSIPATAELLAAIAQLPDGAVVLPGLDQSLDDDTWEAIGTAESPAAAFGHPQFGLKQLLSRLGIGRRDVIALGENSPELSARYATVSAAFRPAETTDKWAGGASGGLDGVALLVARNEQEEALAIALALREAIETKGQTSALVTPDRTIARRVAAELRRWDIQVDDSAGLRLDRAQVAVFAQLLVVAALSEADPVKLLALAKHPFARFGMNSKACAYAARMLEVGLFRGHRVAGGIRAVLRALRAAIATPATGVRQPAARKRMYAEDWQRGESLATALAEALAPLEKLAGRSEVAVAEMTSLLVAALTKATTDDKGLSALADDEEAGEAAALIELLTGLQNAGELMLPPGDYPFFLAAVMGDVAVAPPAGGDPRIAIWGTLEARLQSVDVMVLAGLDEGAWPNAVRTDPFLSRAMRAEIGLPPPERRLGQMAHDFAEGLMAKRVIVTRAEKRGGAPTVESRWLQRLKAVAGEKAAEAMAERGQRHVAIARVLDRAPDAKPTPVARPEPKPPLAARPRHLSITEIETLIRDPYAIYARHVLRLRPLDPLGLAPDSALRGTILHEALGRFTQEWSAAYGDAAEKRLIEIGRECLAAIADFPDTHAVWSIRFRAIARWFVAWENTRAGTVSRRHAEVKGELPIPSPGGDFTLTGRADRIDEMRDGSLAIYDFKTGTPQTERTVFAGLTPQMTLEAAMARAGKFADVTGGRSVSDLAWLAIGRAGRDNPYVSAVIRKQTPDGLAERAHAMLVDLIHAFDSEEHGYLSRARPMMANSRYIGDYDHLARVREWALVESAADVAMMGGPAP